jgi:hypothetical protein
MKIAVFMAASPNEGLLRLLLSTSLLCPVYSPLHPPSNYPIERHRRRDRGIAGAGEHRKKKDPHFAGPFFDFDEE